MAPERLSFWDDFRSGTKVDPRLHGVSGKLVGVAILKVRYAMCMLYLPQTANERKVVPDRVSVRVYMKNHTLDKKSRSKSFDQEWKLE